MSDLFLKTFTKFTSQHVSGHVLYREAPKIIPSPSFQVLQLPCSWHGQHSSYPRGKIADC
uniref:Uncharacterized protein n=1 Tax=Anguilla anguilla TaxID=7936 RepID=A0A0E9UJ43_ANGAN